MSFFTQLASAVATNLVNSLTNSVPVDPFKVVEVSSSNYVSRAILNRESFLIVYGNGPGVNGYELVTLMLMTGNRDKMYSLCRSNDLAVVNQHFQITKNILPILQKISVDVIHLFHVPKSFENLFSIVNHFSCVCFLNCKRFGLSSVPTPTGMLHT